MKKIFYSKMFAAFLVVFAVIYLAGCGENSTDPVDLDPSVQMSEEELMKELNLARTNPALYATFLEARKKYYNGKLYEVPGETPISTSEGVQGVQIAIDFLKSITPRSALIHSIGITKAARDHCKDIGPKGKVSHTGSDGSDPFDRMNRYGEWDITAGENISFGSKTARDVLIQLIIDDGQSSRGHRENIFEEEFKYAGVAFGYHKQYGVMSVQDFAAEYTEK